ncbi:MAG: DedA family protein [Anaerolineae bacterium]|nr:DedA family protein [Anaerolineae bacterium]
MSTLLEQLRVWIEQIVSVMGYFGIALLMFIENIFPPIPSEFVLPFAGFLINKGEMNWSGVLISGTSGALLGALTLYYIGVWIEEAQVRQWFKTYGRYILLKEKDFDRAKKVFDRHGQKIVLIGRVVPAVRSLISLPAGFKPMKTGTFLFFTALGTTIWNVVLTYTGVILGTNWDRILGFIDRYELTIQLVLGGLVAFFVIRRIRGLAAR